MFTEGEYKTLAIAEALQKVEPKRKFAVIGLQGATAAGTGTRYVVPPRTAATRRTRGHPQLIEDLQEIEWKNARVYIGFDSDVGSRKHAAAFKQSRHSGAWGAEYTLAELLRAQGAEVRIVEIPD